MTDAPLVVVWVVLVDYAYAAPELVAVYASAEAAREACKADRDWYCEERPVLAWPSEKP